MDQGDRRIRSLKLKSRDGTLLVQARYRLEEAFRTASMPGLPPNAQLLVRCLDLGSIRAGQTPTMLANRISELMRNLSAAATCVDCQPATTANAVWFSDPLQPYKVLLLRLLDGKGVQEWYWRTLFPHRILVLNSATIGMILSQAAITPLGGLAPARLLQEALEPRRLTRLFPCVTTTLARCLLHEQGLTLIAAGAVAPQTVGRQAEASNAGAMYPVAAPTLSLPWRAAIQQAVQYWGAQDVRTLWFAWHALISHHPAWLERKEVLQRIEPGAWLKSWARTTTGMAAKKETAPAAVIVIDKVRPDLEAQHTLKEMPKASAPPAESVSAAGSAPELFVYEAGPLATPPSIHSPVAEGRAADPSRSAKVEQHDNDTRPAEAPLQTDRIETHGADLPHSVVTPFSSHAGFAFVIPLFQRLGMTELLACNERLVALDLPRQLLWSLALRFGMAASDPLRPLFADFETSGDAVIAPFCPPRSWQRLATASGRPLNASGMAGKEDSIQLHGLIKMFQLLAALYLRRHCRLSLRTLIQRPGRVVMTATHWDVIFDLNQIDLRLRRIALDSDPGWVAWLGRVVQFHYDSEGERYV